MYYTYFCKRCRARVNDLVSYEMKFEFGMAARKYDLNYSVMYYSPTSPLLLTFSE